MTLRAVCDFLSFDYEQRQRYTLKILAWKQARHHFKPICRAYSRMLHAVYGTCIFHVSSPSAGHCSQVCHSCSLQAWKLSIAPTVTCQLTRAILWHNGSQLLQSFLPDWLLFNLASCSMSVFSFQRSLPRDPQNSSAGPALEFWGSSLTDHPSILIYQIAHFVGSVPSGGPQKFQRRSCTGILGVRQDRPSKFRQRFADKSD